MNEAFKLFEDMIHEEHRDMKTFICLNQHFSWESNIPLPNRELKTMLFENSPQQSLLDSDDEADSLESVNFPWYLF
jgi:hypothetical protein